MSKDGKNINTPEQPPPPEGGKRARILEVAGKMFMEQGYSAVSMDAIAEAAPVSKPTLYNHFDDKKTLFKAIMEARCGTIFDALEHSFDEGKDVASTLSIIGQRFLDLVLSPNAIAIHRVILAESGTFPDLGQLFYEAGPKKVIARLAAYFQRQHESGTLVVPDPARAASLFLNMIKGEHHMRCLLRLGGDTGGAERKRAIDYAVRIFIAGHAPV